MFGVYTACTFNTNLVIHYHKGKIVPYLIKQHATKTRRRVEV